MQSCHLSLELGASRCARHLPDSEDEPPPSVTVFMEVRIRPLLLSTYVQPDNSQAFSFADLFKKIPEQKEYSGSPEISSVMKCTKMISPAQ